MRGEDSLSGSSSRAMRKVKLSGRLNNAVRCAREYGTDRRQTETRIAEGERLKLTVAARDRLTIAKITDS